MVRDQSEAETIQVGVKLLDGSHCCQCFSFNGGVVTFWLAQLSTPIRDHPLLTILYLTEDCSQGCGGSICVENELLAEIWITKNRRSGEPVFKLFKSFLAARSPLESFGRLSSQLVEGLGNS